MICNVCGKDLKSGNQKFCSNCGASVSPDTTCKKCGAKNDEDAVFCEKCGENLNKSKTVMTTTHSNTNSNIAPKEGKKKKTGLWIGLASVSVVLVVVLGVFVIRPQMLRSQVDEYLESMQYTEAQATYEKLPERMRDSTEYLIISLLADLENGKYVAATSKLIRLGGYNDAADLLDKSDEVIRIIKQSGIKLPSTEENIVSNAVDTIAEDAIEKMQSTHDPALIGTWVKPASYGYSWKEEFGVDNEDGFTFNRNGTMVEICYIANSYIEQGLRDQGCEIEILSTQTKGSETYHLCRVSRTGKWTTAEDGKLEITYNVFWPEDGTGYYDMYPKDMRARYTIEGTRLILGKSSTYYRQ